MPGYERFLPKGPLSSQTLPTGGISLAEGGILKQHLAPETLERLLTAKLMPEEDDQKPNLLERVKGWISK